MVSDRVTQRLRDKVFCIQDEPELLLDLIQVPGFLLKALLFRIIPEHCLHIAGRINPVEIQWNRSSGLCFVLRNQLLRHIHFLLFQPGTFRLRTFLYSFLYSLFLPVILQVKQETAFIHVFPRIGRKA